VHRIRSLPRLHLARREGKGLTYAGRSGTGFTQKIARELRQVLDELVTERPQVSGAPLRPKSTWVRPERGRIHRDHARWPLAARLVQGAAATIG
jgi:ATP-dependent DNA ligase